MKKEVDKKRKEKKMEMTARANKFKWLYVTFCTL